MWPSPSRLLTSAFISSIVVSAQSSGTSSTNLTAILELLEASVPECAFNCFVSVVPQSTCALTDTDCICSNADLAAAMSTCLVQRNCTVFEQLQTLKFEKQMCGAEVHDIGDHILAITWALYAMSLMAVIARLIARASQLSVRAWDDWTMIACLLALTPASAIGHLLVTSGLGRDIWMLSQEEITNMLFYFFVEEYLYTFLVVFTKISILCLYIRIFTVSRFRLICYTLIGIVLAFGISCWVSTAFNCVPITYMWQGWDGQHSGVCMDTSKQAFALAGVNMSLDILIFILPIPQLLALQMSRKRKIGVILMFTVGLFVTICSIIRLHTIMSFGNSTNPTYDYSDLAVWSLVEIDVGVICACMPGMAGLLQRLWPRLFSTRGSSGNSDPKQVSGSNNASGSFQKRGFARIHDLANTTSKTSSVTVTQLHPQDRLYDSKSDELELMDREACAAPSPDVESAAYAHGNTPSYSAEGERRRRGMKW